MFWIGDGYIGGVFQIEADYLQGAANEGIQAFSVILSRLGIDVTNALSYLAVNEEIISINTYDS